MSIALYLQKGANVPAPTPGDLAVFLDVDGVVKTVDSNGAKGAFGVPGPAIGANLTDANATINPATDKASLYTLPAATPRTANRTLTLGTGGSPITNHVVSVWILGGGAFTYLVQDDASTALFTFASGATKQIANFYFNGTHYVFLSMQYTA